MNEKGIDIIETLISIWNDIYKVSKIIIYYALWLNSFVIFFITCFYLMIKYPGNSNEGNEAFIFYLKNILPITIIITLGMIPYTFRNNIKKYFSSKIKYKEVNPKFTTPNQIKENNYKAICDPIKPPDYSWSIDNELPDYSWDESPDYPKPARMSIIN